MVAAGVLGRHDRCRLDRLDRSAAAKPIPGSPPAPKKEETSPGGAEALTEALRGLVKEHGIDPEAKHVRRAIQTFVAAVVPASAK